MSENRKGKSLRSLSGKDIRPVVFPGSGSVVVDIEGVWKQYRLGIINHGTLAHDIQSWWARLRGKEDPNLRVDQSLSNRRNDESFWALQDVSFNVCQGDVFGIVGANGAGKSTLLKILSKVTTPTRGQIKFKGRIASLLEVGTGFNPELTGRENIFLNGAILGMSKQEIVRKLDEIIAFAEIERFIDTPVKRYSSGMYVRLAFAVAAHLEPEILVIDEVLAVGDLSFQKKCLQKMEEVSGEGRTVLFVSHNMTAVQRLCSKAVLLFSGAVVAEGETAMVVEEYLKRSVVQDHLSFNLERFNQEEYSENHLRFVSCRMRNSQNEETLVFDYGEPILIDFDMVAGKDCQNLAFHIGIDDAKGNRIFTSDSEEFGRLVNMSPGRYRVSVKYDTFFLMPGCYTLSKLMARQGRQTLVQVLGPIGRFEVTQRAFAQKCPPMVGTGIVSGKSEWTVEDA